MPNNIISRLTVGYLQGKEVDLLTDEIADTRDFLLHLREATDTDVRAWYAKHIYSVALNIKLSGELRHLEATLDEIIRKEEGLPSFVKSPISGHHRLSWFQTKLRGRKDAPWTPTTYDSYDMIKGKYAADKIKLSHLIDGTEAQGVWI